MTLPTTCPTCGGPRPVRPPDPCSDEFHHGPRVAAEAELQEERELRRAAMDRVEELESAIREHRDRWASQSTETDDALYAVLEGKK